MLRTNVNEVDVDAVDVGDELRQGIQLRLGLAPVVVRAPITHQLLEFCELYALRPIIDRLSVGPSRGRDASAQVEEGRFRNVDRERPDRVAFAGLVGRDGRMRGKQADDARGCRSSQHVAPGRRRHRLPGHDHSP